MEWLSDSWSLWILLASAFVIGWGAETAQTFMSRALALSILAWLQTAPEFAVEATIAWNQQTDLMIANLTGSLRLLVGLGWPMIFFVYMTSTWMREKRFIKHIELGREDSLAVIFLFISIAYFFVIFGKRSLTVYDAALLVVIYFAYLILAAKMPTHEAEHEDEEDLPWIGKKIVKLPKGGQIAATTAIFLLGGVALYFSAHPFIGTLEKWSLSLGISTFVFVQWVAPFLSEFPEKVSAFNWARQRNKAPMAVMNMVNSNVNQWTMLAAMIPVVFSISRGVITPVLLDDFHSSELALTVAQSLLGGLLLLDLEFSIYDAAGIFILWVAQFFEASLREPITVIYVIWSGWVVAEMIYRYARARQVPKAFSALRTLRFSKVA